MTTDLQSYNLTADDVALKLGYTPTYVRLLARDGKLPALKRIRKWMFCEAEILESLKKNTENLNLDR